jgi:hypothetical protein
MVPANYGHLSITSLAKWLNIFSCLLVAYRKALSDWIDNIDMSRNVFANKDNDKKAKKSDPSQFIKRKDPLNKDDPSLTA